MPWGIGLNGADAQQTLQPLSVLESTIEEHLDQVECGDHKE